MDRSRGPSISEKALSRGGASRRNPARLKRPVGMASLSRSVRRSGDPLDVFVGANVNAGGGNQTRPTFQPGRAGALAFGVSVVSLRAQVRSAAD